MEHYKRAAQQFHEYNKLKEFIGGLSEFLTEVETLYFDVQREYATANMWARREVFIYFL